MVALGCGLGAIMVLKQPQFGALPQGRYLERIQRSANYYGNEFRNPLETPLFADGVTMFSVLWGNLFAKKERLVPEHPLPAQKVSLHTMGAEPDLLIWLGHSSWYLQLEGKRILIDPVLSPYGAPFSFMNKAFAGTSPYSVEDMPAIDYLLLSHDHYDHLDYATLKALQPKVGMVICPLGVGTSLLAWGYGQDQIEEGDWADQFQLGNGLTLHILPARHYSGRMMVKNKTLWAGFALVTPTRRLFYSGDSGYGPHFAQIGQAFKGFDLVLLDCGQYDSRWPLIHMTPEEAVRAAQDLGAAALIPAHVGRFTIANHPWDEPFERVLAASKDSGLVLKTPQIGEPLDLDVSGEPFTPWWRLQ
ncbi:MBL fold metallo-hydrolase [Desulfobulbus rhabdoformis]|nr:MBL fold metallo-hydrolase [Desulfobulbus rhabdoformis]